MAATTERPPAKDERLDDAPARPQQTGGLDMLLTEAASGGGTQRWVPGMAGVRAAAKLAVRPQRVASRTAGLAGELAARFRAVRARTEALCEPLATEDYVVQ